MTNSRSEPPTALMVRIQLWPVLERRTNDEGVIQRSKESYVRTKAPTMEREVEVWDIPSETRVTVYFGSGHNLTFSVKTGRAVGRQDWIIEAESLKALRKFFKTDETRAARAIDRCFMALVPKEAESEDGDED